jgi:capsular exopolysaccharide synthesis family protein
MEPQNFDNSTLGARHYIEVIRRRKWLVLGMVVATMAAAAAVSAATKPTYRATTKIIVGQGGTLFAPEQANAIQPFSATMKDLLKSNVVAGEVIRNLSLTETEESLLANVDVTTKPESSALQLAVTDHDRRRAQRIADEFGQVFSNLVRDRFGRTQQPTTPDQPQTPELSAIVWDPAHIDPVQVSPKPKRNVAIAGVLGLVVGLLAGFLREYFDRGLRTREAVEEAFGLPVIGQIPAHRRRAKRPAQGRLTSPFAESAEAYRALRANLQYLAVQRPLQTILLTSAAPGQGKTTVTANLAAAIARSGASTVAVEGDLRRPQLAEALGIEPTGPGLTGVLVGSADIEQAVLPLSMAGAQDGDDLATLAFLPSGYLPPNPSELLSSTAMESVLNDLRVLYDYVLIDSPPLLLVADALELARTVDGTILVARRNYATRDDAAELRAIIERLDIHLVGTVFTGVAARSAYTRWEYGRSPRPTPPRSGMRDRVASERS